MTAIRVELFDSFGVRQDVVNAVPVDGPIQGAHSFSYVGHGNVLDKESDASFVVPLTFARNAAAGIGNHIKIYEDDTEVFWGIITTTSVAVSANGREATLTVPCVLRELSQRTVTTGIGTVNYHLNTTAPTIQDIGIVLPRVGVNGDGTPAPPSVISARGAGQVNGAPPVPAAARTNPGAIYDPVPTTPAETAQQFLTRLINPQFPSLPAHWDLVNDFTTFDGYSLRFAAHSISITECVGQFGKQFFCHYKTHGRTLYFGRFLAADGVSRVDSGIRLIRGTSTPWMTALNDEVREILSFDMATDGNFVNDVTPLGAGTGSLQVTLEPLYKYLAAGGSDLRVNPGVYPIFRRPTLDGSSRDGYDYYLQDANSINTYGLLQNTYSAPKISVSASPTSGEMLEAAIALYLVATAYLSWHSKPNTVLSVTTESHGTLLDIAGKTVRVYYPDTVEGQILEPINGDYVVMEARQSWDQKGKGTTAWTLSSQGQFAESDFQVFTGTTELVDHYLATPNLQIVPENIPFDAPIGSGTNVNAPVDAWIGVVRTVEATFNVSLLPLYSTLSGGTVVPHTHTVGLPALDIQPFVPPVNEAGANAGLPGGTTQFQHPGTGNPNQYPHGHSTSTAGQGAKTNMQSVTNGSQFSHAHGSSVAASGGGNVGSAGVPAVTTAFNTHYHTTLVQGGGTPTSLGDAVVYARGTEGVDYHLQASNYKQGHIRSDPGIAYDNASNFDHSHGISTLATGGGNVNGNPNGGFNPSVDYGGFAPTVKAGGVPTDGGGFQPNPQGGFAGATPNTQFPGTSTNLQTTPTSIQTSDAQVQPGTGWTPTYGLFTDTPRTGYPAKPSNVQVGVSVDGGALVTYPQQYNNDFTLDFMHTDANGIPAYPEAYAAFAGGHGVLVVFSSATYGRLVIRARIIRHAGTGNWHS